MGSTKQDDINYSFLWFLPPQCSVQILVVVTTPTTSATTPRPTRSCTWGVWPSAFRTVTYLPHLANCDYLLYWEPGSGPDENCKIISGPGNNQDEMAKYLGQCGVIGQPMTDNGDQGGNCIWSGENVCPAVCGNKCQDCTNDPCNGVRETNCLMEDTPGETSPGAIPDYNTCFQFCRLQMTSNP